MHGNRYIVGNSYATYDLEKKRLGGRERERERWREKIDFPIAKEVHLKNIFPMYFPILLDIKNKLSKIEYSNGVLPNNKLGILANSFYLASELK